MHKFILLALAVMMPFQFAFADPMAPGGASDQPSALTKPRTKHRPQVGDITDEETTQIVRRRESLSLTEIGFGPAWTSNMKRDGMCYMGTLGHHWDVAEQAELKIDGWLGLKGGEIYTSAGLGGSYFFSRGNFAPLLGADFGFGYANGSNVKSIFGFAVSGTAGVRLFRTSTTQLELNFKYGTILKANQAGDPALYGFTIALLY